MINKSVFKSNKKKLLRSDNSIAMTTDKDFVSIVQFIVCAPNDQQFVLCHGIDVREDFNYCPSMKTVIDFKDDVRVIETVKLKKLCVLIKSISHSYLSAVPHVHVFS